MGRSAFGTGDYKLAFLAAVEVIGFEPSDLMLQELSELCRSPEDCMAAVRAMRDAPKWHRVSSAFDVLRDRRREERRAAEGADHA